MYRRPKFLETLLDIREQMAAEADHDVELFVDAVRSGKKPKKRARKTVAAGSDTTKRVRTRRLVTK